MPSLEQFKTYKTSCEKELERLVDMANTKIEGMDETPGALRQHESPISYNLTTYPITLDGTTRGTYDLSDIIDLDALENGVIKLKLEEHPETRSPIIADDLIIYTLLQRQEYIKQLEAFLEKELQAERLNQLLSSFEASLNAEPEAAPQQPNPVVAEKRPQPDPNPNPAPYPAARPQPLADEAQAVKPAPDRNIPWDQRDYDGISMYKILVMGDAGSGKSCLLNRHLEGSFDSRRKTTMGVDFELKSINIPGQACSARLQLWVQPRRAYSIVERLYYKQADGIIITINLNQENGLENTEKLLQKIRTYLPASTPTLLVGCQSDLEQKISREAIGDFAEKHGMPYFETSAMLDRNIDEPFAYLTEQLYLKQHPEAAPMAANPDEQIKALEDKRRSLSDFNIKHFNELVKKAKLNTESRKKLSESLITALHNKTDELLQTLDARSHHLSKAIDVIRALNSIKNGVELIKMSSVIGFIFSTSQSDQMNAIDNRISLIKEKLDEVAARNNSSLFDLALMKFKLIDCTCLDELKPISDQLLGMLRVAEQGVESFTKDINPKNGGIKECDANLKAIREEVSNISFRHLKMLTTKQRDALQAITKAADDCLNVRKKNLSDYHQISLVIEEAKLGIDYAPAPQNRHRH